jgi:alpha-tubulin suppressor-like RCC1 family protein
MEKLTFSAESTVVDSSKPEMKQQFNFSICMSKVETTILTPTGDVLVCRGRDSFHNSEDIVASQPVSANVKSSLCSMDHEHFCDHCILDITKSQHEEMATPKSQTGEDCGKENQIDLLTPQSFDYSNFEPLITEKASTRPPLSQVPEKNFDDEGTLVKIFGDLMAPTLPSGDKDPDSLPCKIKKMEPLCPPSILHGIPICLMRDIRISSISAHPLGSHVLLISTTALLFSYGANSHGQLGLGTQEPFVSTPTLVTSVLEGAGKTILCAAGVDYSLICVQTKQDWIQRSNGKRGGALVDATHYFHHQVYGFGSNKAKKLGLFKDTKQVCNALPHRVALHSKVKKPVDSLSTSLPLGIFCLAASYDHSAAIVRRATGAVDLYMWGASGSRGLASADGAVTKVESLSYAKGFTDDEDSYLKPSEFPESIALGHNCTFVLLNSGRCLSFGESSLLPSKASLEPTEIQLDAPIKALSVGAQHVLATCTDNRVYVWGFEPAARMEHGTPCELPQRALHSFAGLDASAFVLHDGTVLTCGSKSGRLGQGEVPPNSRWPTPLFGGLRLWR